MNSQLVCLDQGNVENKCICDGRGCTLGVIPKRRARTNQVLVDLPSDDEKYALDGSVLLPPPNEKGRKVEAPKRGEGKKKQKKWKVKTKKEIVAAAVAESEQKEAGENDALEALKADVLADLLAPEHPGVVEIPYHYVMCKALHRAGVGGKDYMFSDSDYFGLTVFGTFKFPDDVPLTFAGWMPFLQTRHKILSTSESGLVMKVAGLVQSGHKANFESIDVSTIAKIVLQDTVHRLNYAQKLDHMAVIERAKANYKRYFADFPGLTQTIADLVNSEWFEDLYHKQLVKNESLWEKRLMNRLRASMGRRGEDADLCFTIKPSPLFRASQELWCAFIYGINILNPFAVRMPYSTCRKLHVMDWKKYQLQVLSAHEFPNQLPGFVPCSKIELRKMVTTTDRIPVITRHLMDVKCSYTDVDQPETDSTVEMFGTTIPGPMVYPANCAQNLHAALAIRMGQTVANHGCHEVVDAKFGLGPFVKYAKRLIDQMPSLHVIGEGNAEHLANTYGQVKGAQLLALADEELTMSDLCCKLFVKGEIYLGKEPDNFKPRMIWSRSGKIIGKFSIYFKQIGDYLAKLFDGSEQVYYTCKSTPDTVGEFAQKMCDKQAHVYESDVSNWDGSLSNEILMLENYFIHQKVTGLPDEFDLMLREWGNMKGVGGKGEVTVSMEHGRRSGDLWTSCFNSLINVLIVMWIHKLNWNSDFNMLVLGDDNVVAHSTDVTPDVARQMYLSIGMNCEIIERKDISEVGYCSGEFWPVGDHWRWSNKPFRVMAKLGVNHNGHARRKYKRLLYGTVKSLMPTAGHLPVLGTLLRKLADDGQESRLTPLYDNAHENPYRIQGGVALYPDSATYALFCERYNVDILEVLAMEEAIECGVRLDECPYLFDGTFYLDAFERDVGNHGAVCQEHTEDVAGVDPVVVLEEREKMHGTTTLFGALVQANQFGQEEDEMAGTKSHRFLHMLFTTVSWINFRAGCLLHARYNDFARWTNRPPCKKKGAGGKKRGRRAKRFQPGHLGEGMKEPNWLKRVVKAGLIHGGQGIGDLFGHGELGARLGAGISRIIGSGAYKIAGNSIWDAERRVVNVSFAEGVTEIRLKHSEMVRAVSGSTSFSQANVPINPGMALTTPWAAGITPHFSIWVPHGWVQEFRSYSADALNSTNTALGTVIQATNYNAEAPVFYNRAEMEAYQYTTASVPSTTAFHAVECARGSHPLNQYYVRNAAVPDGQDARFYDLGRYTLATDGMQAAAVIGELWAHYDITLKSPVMDSGATRAPLFYQSVYTTFDNSNVFGSTSRTGIGSMTMEFYDTNTLLFPTWVRPGTTFLVEVAWTGASTACTQPTLTLTGCTAADYTFSNNTVSQLKCPATTGTSTRVGITILVKITSYAATIAFASGTLPATGTYSDVLVTSIPHMQPPTIDWFGDVRYKRLLQEIERLTVEAHATPQMIDEDLKECWTDVQN